MATWRINSGASAIWQPSTAYGLGDRVVCTIAYGTQAARARVFECTTAGTSGGSEPTWDTVVNNTTNDNTVVWTCRSPDDGNWSNASCYLFYVLNHASVAAGDSVYVHSSHNETTSFVGTYSVMGSTNPANWIKILCVDKDNSDALDVGAQVNSNNALESIYFKGHFYSYGILYRSQLADIYVADGTNGCTAVLESDGSDVLRLDASLKRINLGSAAMTKRQTLRIINAGINLQNINHSIIGYQWSFFHWRKGAITSPNGLTSLFAYAGTGTLNKGVIENVDLTDIGAGATATALVDISASASYDLLFTRCNLPSDAGFTITEDNLLFPVCRDIRFYHCSSGNNTYDFLESSYEGTVQDEVSIYRTNGFEHGTTHLSYKMVTNANAKDLISPLESPPIQSWTDAGGSITFTVEGVWDSATNIQNDEIWIELEYPANNTDGLGNVMTDRAAPLATPSDQAASSEGWTGTGGMSNENKFKLSITATPGKAGPVTARVYLAKSSTTVYIDPVITES